MNVSESIRYVGVNDRKIDLFEGQYIVPEGMAYNSYLVLDEKIAVMDSVDARFAEEWLKKLSLALEGKRPDYLVVHHMEPDHSGSIAAFAEAYPEAVIVSSAQAFRMMKNFFGTDFQDRRLVVAEGSTLSLGTHALTFVAAPMVHWPEVITSYEAKEKVLFSADAFGKFGALDAEEDWACEARRYYIGIVGKYGTQVQALLKKVAALDVKVICPLHGPVLKGNLSEYLSLYNTWSSYEPEEEGVMIAYTSVYGNTKKAVLYLEDQLRRIGCKKVVVNDLARCDMAEAVEDAFRYSKLVLATTTYNGDIFPFMRSFLDHLTERGYKKRRVALMENGSWAPTAAKVMRGMLEGANAIDFVEPSVCILSAMTEENQLTIKALARELVKE
ncbi:MAG: FprA family A-type flavoprotein [Clostridia bacterium]|nr:FprA family A-type flavoprotein [Clostridia bacterium]